MKPLILLLGLFGLVFQGQAQDTGGPSPIIFIYDASGSMWGQMAGQTKMEIASSVLTQTVNNLPENQQFGLVAYGHRNKSDCKDVEFLVEVDGGSKASVNQALAAITPLGKTPLAWSATQVIDKLRSSGQKATIILVTDGIESCGGSICEVIAAAKKEGIDFKLHIVGFGLKESETEQLKCAAQAGQGNYYDAADAGALSKVLNEATEATVDAPAGNFTVYASKNGEPVDALVSAFKAGTKENVDAIRTYRDTVFLSLPAGKYDLKAQPLENTQIDPVTLLNIESFEDSVAHQSISFDGAMLLITTLKNGDGWDTMVKINSQNGTQVGGTRTYGRTRNVEISPGVYDLELTALAGMVGLRTTHVIEDVTLAAGDTTKIEHVFKTGTASLGAQTGNELADVLLTIFTGDKEKGIGGGRTYTSENRNPRTYIINPGTYAVRLRGRKEGKDTIKWYEFSVKEGETITKMFEW